MKTLLLVLCAAAALLVVGLFFWGRSAPSPTPVETRASEVAPPVLPPAERLSDGGQPHPTAAVAPPAAANRETAVRSSAGAEPESDLPLLTDLSSGVAPASIDQMRAQEYERFAKKYEPIGAAGRKIAREAIQEILRSAKADPDRNGGNGGENGQRLSEEDITAFNHELEWLEANPNP